MLRVFLYIPNLAIVHCTERKINSGTVYQLIFDDLTLAKDYLKNYVRSGDNQKFKPNVAVVNGLLARAYF